MTLVWAPSFNGVTDPDAQTYLAAVEAADGQAIEGDVALAINDFVVGCKLDGIWDAIKASCILAGARTLNGALVPLVGAAPTNNNFVSGDYNRETGLVGDGSTKYLDSNRADNDDPTDSLHQCVYATQLPTIGAAFMGAGGATTGTQQSNFFTTGARNRTSNTVSFSAVVGLIGSNRSSSDTVDAINGGAISSGSYTSTTPSGFYNHFVFARDDGSPNQISNARLAFYSIGESLDLAALDNRVTTLMTDIGAAIP